MSDLEANEHTKNTNEDLMSDLKRKTEEMAKQRKKSLEKVKECLILLKNQCNIIFSFICLISQLQENSKETLIRILLIAVAARNTQKAL